MTDSLFFDTDCLSAFLWVKGESLLPKLYPGRIILPQPVYSELSRPCISHLKARVDTLLAQEQISIQTIDISSEEYKTYYQLTESPAKGHKIIGNGEAASISLAKHYGGIVASNNLKDIITYVSEFGLNHKTTGDILVDAHASGLISEEDGNDMWAKMLSKRRKLGSASFTDYLTSKQCQTPIQTGKPHG